MMKDGLETRLKKLVIAAPSQKALARLAGISDATIINWTNGLGHRESKLQEFAHAVGVNPDWLLHGRGDEAEELARFAETLHGGAVRETPPAYAPAAYTPPKMESAHPHCRRIIEHITRNLSSEHFTEAQLRVMQDAEISTGERERIVQHMAAILSARLSAKQHQRQKTN